MNVLVLGANGQLARNTTRAFLERTDAKLTLYLRRAKRLQVSVSVARDRTSSLAIGTT